MNDRELGIFVRILLECDRISERVERFDIQRKRFVSDGALADMLLMPLVQIGELSVHVDGETLKEIMPLQVWKQVRGFRNIIVHSYGSINRDWAWETIERDIPDLRARLLAKPEIEAAYNSELEALALETTQLDSQ